MSKKVYDGEINKNTDWGGDSTTGNLPVSGRRVQEFIKKTLNEKMGVFHYDESNNRYIVFADEESRDKYLEDPTNPDNIKLLLGSFEAPFNYSAEITLTSQLFNVIPLNSTGNFIEFTCDIKNKQNISTGEGVIVTYTFIRNSIKKVITESRRCGDFVRLNIDQYLGEGTNTIIIGITGQSTLAATTVSITYQVINLFIKDEFDISKIHDLSNTNQAILDIPFTVAGYGTKRVEWFIDGNLLEFVKDEDEVVDVETSRVKSITLTNLQHGRHSLQLRAYTTINGDKFYTDTLYRNFFVSTGASEELMLGVAISIPSKYGIVEASQNPTIYNMEQYIPYTLRVASYSPINAQNTEINVSLENEVKGSVVLNNDEEGSITLISSESGNKVVRLYTDDVEYTIPVNIKPTSMNIGAITNGLELDFTAVGKNNTLSDRDTWSYGEYTGRLTGFKWNNTSGWVNNRLLMSAGSAFSIDYAPLAGSPTSTGKTIELEFSTQNVRNDDAVICDLRDENGTGLLITATKVSLTSVGKVTVETEFRSGENVRIAFVINRSRSSNNKCMSFIYTNGILSRADKWLESDSYSCSKKIKFTATDEVEVSLKAIRVYNAPLSSDQVLNNFILYRDTLSEMLSVYDRNDVYTEGTSSFSPNKMMGRLPVMIITGDMPKIESASTKDVQIVVDIEYYNMQDPTRSFKITSAALRPQGTSSLGYPKKNMRFYTRKVAETILLDYNGNVVADKLYSFKEGAQPVDTWCLKADYAESSGTHNTGIARLWNKALYDVQLDGQYVCRTNAQKAAASSGYEYDVRTAIDGFPILLFYRLNANDDLIFMGKYNFNNDKSTESVFGFKGIPGFDNSRMQCWEVLNNGNDIALFKTTANWDDKDKGWKKAFESRYPDTESPNTDDLKAFCEWMSTVTQEDFDTQKHEHLNLYMMAAYYIYLMRYAAVDQFVKNAMFTSEDGIHFYYIHYDNDTINGLINSGRLIVKPDATRESKDETGAYIFAGHDSRLWNMLEADTEFMDLVRRMDNALYSAGISYINSIKMFDEEQADKWVERVYNQDAQYKYIGPYSEKGIDNLFMLQGKRDLHRKWWLAKRFSIYDAKFVTGPYKSQAIIFKCINGTPTEQSFSITAGTSMSYGYGVNNDPRDVGVSLNKGESHTFTTNEVLNIGDPVRIYGAANISAVDLSPMIGYIAEIDIANVYDESLGTSLTTLILGNATEPNNSISSISGLKQATKLEKLDVRNLRALKSLDLSNQLYLKELLASNSELNSVTLAKGCPLNKISVPATMTNISFEQLPELAYNNITFDSVATVKNITVKSCKKISNNFNFIYNWFTAKSSNSNECSLIMDNIDWSDVDAAQLLRLGELKELRLKGVIRTTEVTEEQLTELLNLFGSNIFDPTAELYIIAPPSVYLIGPSEVLEGTEQQYQCVVTGEELIKATFTIVSGSSSYISMSPSGLLTVNEGQGATSVTIQVTAILTSTTVTKQLTIRTVARTYPTQYNTSIQGEQSLVGEETTYTIQSSNGVNGKFITEWTLEGMDGYAEIKESNNTSCVIRKLNSIVTAIIGTLKATIKKEYNNEQVANITKQVQIVNENIAETDPQICKCLYNAGLCAHNNYITKEEARLVTDADLTSGLFSGITKSCSFRGFQYFTSITTIGRVFQSHYLNELILPPSVISITSSDNECNQLTLNENIQSVQFTVGSIASGGVSSLTIPNNKDIRLSGIKFRLASGSSVINGGASCTTVPVLYEASNIDRGQVDKLTINSTKIKFLYEPKPFNNSRFLLTLPSTVEAPSGGYFEGKVQTEDAVYSEISPNVYIVENKIYYITVNITSNVEDADFTIEYTNQENESISTVVKKGQHILPIKYGTNVKITPHDKANFIAPSVYSTTAKSTLIQPTFNYTESTGIYIEHVNGTLYTADEWTAGGFSNDDANGVAVVRPISGSFVIAKERTDSLKFGGSFKIPSEFFKTRDEALLDNDGYENTKRIIEALQGVEDGRYPDIIGTPAASYCVNYTFPNGNKGYLGAVGQAQCIADNYYNINKAFRAMGSSLRFGNYPDISSLGYTSTVRDDQNIYEVGIKSSYLYTIPPYDSSRSIILTNLKSQN